MCMAPAWWNKLKKFEQDRLIRRMTSFGRGNRYLEFSGVVHDDWDFLSSEFLAVSEASSSGSLPRDGASGETGFEL